VRQVGYNLLELYRDARSPEYKIIVSLVVILQQFSSKCTFCTFMYTQILSTYVC